MKGRNSLFWNPDITNTECRALLASFKQHGFDNLIHAEHFMYCFKKCYITKSNRIGHNALRNIGDNSI